MSPAWRRCGTPAGSDALPLLRCAACLPRMRMRPRVARTSRKQSPRPPAQISEFLGKPNPPGPIRFPDTRFEPVAFGEIDGWAADDHAAAYATFLASCRAIVGSAKTSRDTRPVYPALVEICRKARAAGTLAAAPARKFFEENFRARSGRQGRGSERFSHRLLRADRRRLPHADRRLQGAALRASARSRAYGAQAQGRKLSQHRPRGAAHLARQVRAVFRSRRDRGRRARDAQSGNLLSQGRERSAVHPDPGLGARAPHRRQPAARQLRRAQRPSLYAGRPHPDRAQHHRARRHVDGPHPQVDGGESGRRKRAAAAEQVVCVLPQHRSAGKRGGEGRAGRAADEPAARSRSTARCTSTARRSSSRATCRSRPKHRTRNSAG